MIQEAFAYSEKYHTPVLFSPDHQSLSWLRLDAGERGRQNIR